MAWRDFNPLHWLFSQSTVSIFEIRNYLCIYREFINNILSINFKSLEILPLYKNNCLNSESWLDYQLKVSMIQRLSLAFGRVIQKDK